MVSIIVPAYNAEQWLPDAVASVLAQTFTDWELIIVNDGSTDGTGPLARGYSDSRIRVLEQENEGVSAARNAGIRTARGELITFMDADDAMDKRNLEVKTKALLGSDVDWVFSDVARCDQRLQPMNKVLVGTDGDALRTMLLNVEDAVPNSCNNILARRECFERGVAFDTELSNAADQHFTMQLAARFTYKHVPGALTFYRDVPGSMSKHIQGYQDDHLRLFRKAREAGHLRPASFRRRCMANVYWAIGGSWWLNAHRPMKAFPYLIRAVVSNPGVLVRPLRNRLHALFGAGQGT